jgi:hypothetical protein
VRPYLWNKKSSLERFSARVQFESQGSYSAESLNHSRP